MTVVELLRARSMPRAVALTLIAAAAAGCSADSTRLNDNPFDSRANSGATGSVPPAQTAPAGRVERQTLTRSSLPPPTTRPATVAATGTAGGSRGMASYNPATTAAPDYTGAVLEQRPVSRPVATGHWSWDGGTPITVTPRDTLDSIAQRHGVPAAAIMRANNIPPHTKVNIGDRLVIPGVRTSNLQRNKPAPALANAKPLSASGTARNIPAAPPQSAAIVTPAVERPVAPATPKLSDANPAFRWPARGRVITGFGPRPNGQQNDGINLALPEGTQVKAAEDGVVAYAGNELKGYGNLVLVRHSNGYVTAYAHAKELMVKRGDAIKRGQVIATSGQTGNVDAPQLHFEIRKGPAPVDPMPLLNGG